MADGSRRRRRIPRADRRLPGRGPGGQLGGQLGQRHTGRAEQRPGSRTIGSAVVHQRSAAGERVDQPGRRVLEFDPWIEIYNASSQTVELDGMHLSNSISTPTLWPIPPDTDLCGKCWLLIFVDADVGQGPDPLHASFTLSGAGGFVGLFDTAGTLIDYVNYPSLPADHSYGRFPDGTAEQRIFTTVTVEAANDVPQSR